ncbi:DUF4382 domain-containing protein [Pyxidicoccus fallax]|uniref:DUF4382 domain-containing protein n=1 Tax=Pyxidicoccus fallax TaxID=394095 RepID=A0A848LLS0_9BACT|nr:DUF4382 domain-containing protein [Pyxidicoccus fallax]NMO18708.1 DUF4382 domain-containing protein [Pyxidicoccus fallax]NPC81400.1 DUF4382 domain-containing protein [Pyxidicoccus fallax]
MPLISRLRSSFAALLTVALLPLMGCGGGEGKVTVLMTDAPGDNLKTAVVTISEIYLKGDDDGDDNDDDNGGDIGKAGGDDKGGRVVLLDEPVTVSLLELANKTSELVSEAVVPNGDYSEIRFVITGGYIEVKNADDSTTLFASSDDYAGLPEGARVDGRLHMPSFGSSGLKVKFSEKLSIEGEQKILLVDFDVAQSFGKEAGNSGRWVMRPVIKAAEVTASGSINVTLTKDGGVTLPTVDDHQVTLADFRAVMINAAGSREELVLADTNGDGTFEASFKFLIPGTFSLSIAGPAGITFTTSPAGPVTVELGSGKDITQAFTLISAQAEQQ